MTEKSPEFNQPPKLTRKQFGLNPEAVDRIFDKLNQPSDIDILPENYPYKPFIDYKGKSITPTGIPAVDTSNKSRDEFIRAAYIDKLTGLLNHNAYIERLKDFNLEEEPAATLIICDVNGLKEINDTQGHTAGNELILHTVGLIKEAFSGKSKKTDIQKKRSGENQYNATIFRWGGDEFGIVVTGLKTPEEQQGFENYVKNEFSSQNQSDAKADFSYGIAHFDHNQDQAIDVIDREEGKKYSTTFDRADTAMSNYKIDWKAQHPEKYTARQ